MKTNAELLSELVNVLVEKRGYPFALGYIQSFMLQVDGMNTKKNQAITNSDLEHAIRTYSV